MSRIFTVLSESNSKFEGLMSRWTTFWLWAYSSPFGGLEDVVQGLRDGQRAPLPDHGPQVFPLHVFHDQEVRVAGLVGVGAVTISDD